MVVNGIDSARTPFKILSCPVIGADGKSCGLLALFRSAERPNFELDDVVLIEILSRQAMTLAGGRQDPLTGLLNSSAFERQLERGCGVLLYVDVCDLGSINDAFGFAAGDEVIRRTAQLIRSTLTGDESACRLSGDRFVLYMPDADADTATVRGAELATAAAKLEYVDARQRIPVTFRYGVAAPPEGATSGRHWIAAAERASRQSL